MSITAPGVFYTFTAPTAGLYTLSTCTTATLFDTRLLVYTGPCANLVCVAANDNQSFAQCSFVRAAVQWLATAGTTYYVYVTGGNNNATGQFSLTLTCPAQRVDDATVDVIHTLGRAAAAYASPHAVRASVSNTGSTTLTNLPVTLAVSRATTFVNTQTVASLAPGAAATVAFAPYSLAVGTNTLTVSVPADVVNANNSVATAQVVNATDLSYVNPTTTAFTTNIGFGQANAQYVVRYHTNAPALVRDITPVFGRGTTSGGSYQTVVYEATGAGNALGNRLYTSPAQALPTAPGPVSVFVPDIPVNGDFFVAIE